MVTLATLRTGNKATLLIYANSTTHDTHVLGQHKFVFGWTQHQTILYSWFFFWLVEWAICLRSLKWKTIHWTKVTGTLNFNSIEPKLHCYNQVVIMKLHPGIKESVDRSEGILDKSATLPITLWLYVLLDKTLSQIYPTKGAARDKVNDVHTHTQKKGGHVVQHGLNMLKISI